MNKRKRDRDRETGTHNRVLTTLPTHSFSQSQIIGTHTSGEVSGSKLRTVLHVSAAVPLLGPQNPGLIITARLASVHLALLHSEVWGAAAVGVFRLTCPDFQKKNISQFYVLIWGSKGWQICVKRNVVTSWFIHPQLFIEQLRWVKRETNSAQILGILSTSGAHLHV